MPQLIRACPSTLRPGVRRMEGALGRREGTFAVPCSPLVSPWWTGASCWETFLSSTCSESVPVKHESCPHSSNLPPHFSIFGLSFPAITQLECLQNHVIFYFFFLLSNKSISLLSRILSMLLLVSLTPPSLMCFARASQGQALQPKRNLTLWILFLLMIAQDSLWTPSLLFPGPQLHCLVCPKLHEPLRIHMQRELIGTHFITYKIC